MTKLPKFPFPLISYNKNLYLVTGRPTYPVLVPLPIAPPSLVHLARLAAMTSTLPHLNHLYPPPHLHTFYRVGETTRHLVRGKGGTQRAGRLFPLPPLSEVEKTQVLSSLDLDAHARENIKNASFVLKNFKKQRGKDDFFVRIGEGSDLKVLGFDKRLVDSLFEEEQVEVLNHVSRLEFTPSPPFSMSSLSILSPPGFQFSPSMYRPFLSLASRSSRNSCGALSIPLTSSTALSSAPLSSSELVPVGGTRSMVFKTYQGQAKPIKIHVGLHGINIEGAEDITNPAQAKKVEELQHKVDELNQKLQDSSKDSKNDVQDQIKALFMRLEKENSDRFHSLCVVRQESTENVQKLQKEIEKKVEDLRQSLSALLDAKKDANLKKNVRCDDQLASLLSIVRAHAAQLAALKQSLGNISTQEDHMKELEQEIIEHTGEMREDMNDLEKEVDDLSEVLSKTQKKVSTLSEEVQSQRSTLSSMKSKLDSDHEDIKDTIERFDHDFDKIMDDVNALEESQGQLKSSVDEVSSSLSQLLSEASWKHNDMKEEIEAVRKVAEHDFESHTESIEDLHHEVDELKAEIKALKAEASQKGSVEYGPQTEEEFGIGLPQSKTELIGHLEDMTQLIDSCLDAFDEISPFASAESDAQIFSACCNLKDFKKACHIAKGTLRNVDLPPLDALQPVLKEFRLMSPSFNSASLLFKPKTFCRRPGLHLARALQVKAMGEEIRRLLEEASSAANKMK